MKIYIAGPITNTSNYKERFAKAEQQLKRRGFTPMNPAVLSEGFEHHEYMKICYSMIDVCDGAYFMKDWDKSKGAQMEFDYCAKQGKLCIVGLDSYDEDLIDQIRYEGIQPRESDIDKDNRRVNWEMDRL